ncbi:MAG: apolipoprotein N-acyltransferase [Phycisphaerales bacterium]
MSENESRARRRGAGLGWAERARAAGAGFAFGLLGALSFPPIGLWWLAFLAPAPVMAMALSVRGRPGRVGLWAAAGTLPWWGLAHVWTINVSRLGFVPLVLILAAYTWLFVWIVGRVRLRCGLGWAALLGPVVWAGLEFLRGTVAFDGYAFYLVGHPLIDSPGGVMAAPAAWGGAYLVSGLVAAVAGAVAAAVVLRGWIAPGITVVGVAGMFVAAGATRAAPDPGARTVRFAVAQTNVPQDNKSLWTLRQRVLDWLAMRELVLEAAESDADVIVLPEGMFSGRVLQRDGLEAERAAQLIWPMAPEFPGDAPELRGLADYLPATELADDLIALQGDIGVPLIVGGSGYDAFGVVEEEGGLRYVYDAIYNSVFVVDGGAAPEGRYDKLHLAPFGEVMPYISNWPWLERQLLALGANGMTFSLAAGDDPSAFEVRTGDGSVSVATPICFEGTVPHVCRRLVFDAGQRRAGVLVNLTNDGWFGDWTPGRVHHALACRWRCVELGTPMVRAANTGISGAYDARGQAIADRVIGSDRPDRVAGVVVADVTMGRGSSVYAHVGDAFGWVVLGLTGTALLATFGVGRIGPGRGDASGGPRATDDRGWSLGLSIQMKGERWRSRKQDSNRHGSSRSVP